MSHVNARVIVYVHYKDFASRLLILPLIKSSHDYNMCILLFCFFGRHMSCGEILRFCRIRPHERDGSAIGMFSALNLQGAGGRVGPLAAEVCI
jgi:hypothetical protein